MAVPNKALKGAVIIDPACYPAAGHNIEACLRFAKLLESQGAEEIIFLIAGIAQPLRDQGYTVYTLPAIYPQLYVDNFRHALANKLFRLFFSSLRRSVGWILHHLLLNYAERKLRQHLSQQKLSAEWLVFFPSCDFYYANASLSILTKAAKSGVACKLKLRFIGVMEGAHMVVRNDRGRLFDKIRRFPTQHITVTAETDRYSRYLAGVLRKPVRVEPYPFLERAQPAVADATIGDPNQEFGTEHPLRVGLIGKPRPDKGSLDLLAIAERSLDRFGLRVIFHAVAFDKGSRHYPETSDLKEYPNVALQYGFMPKPEYQASISRIHVVLMPYDNKVFWFRGSAVFFDAIEHGKLIIARDGCAFASEMEAVGALQKYTTINELMGLIERYVLAGPSYIASQAATKYNNYRTWVGNL